MSTATTLSAPGYTIGDPTMNVGATTNYPTDTGFTYAVDEVDSEGKRISGTYNIFRGVVTGGTQISSVVYVGGDPPRDYTAGATTRVYLPVSNKRENRLVDGILVHANQDGTLKDNSVGTDQIQDAAVTPEKRSGGFYIGTIPGATMGSTGNKTITGVGFEPKLIRFTVMPSSNATGRTGYGVATADSQRAVSSYVDASNRHTAQTSASCFMLVESNGSWSNRANLVSMNSDGFVIDVVATGSIPVYFEAYA